jgi:hypothetical protein
MKMALMCTPVISKSLNRSIKIMFSISSAQN